MSSISSSPFKTAIVCELHYFCDFSVSQRIARFVDSGDRVILMYVNQTRKTSQHDFRSICREVLCTDVDYKRQQEFQHPLKMIGDTQRIVTYGVGQSTYQRCCPRYFPEHVLQNVHLLRQLRSHLHWRLENGWQSSLCSCLLNRGKKQPITKQCEHFQSWTLCNYPCHVFHSS